MPNILQHLRTPYKESKDWNRRQLEGNLCESPHFDVRSGIPSRAELNSFPLPSANSTVSDWETTKRKERKNKKTRTKKRRNADSVSDGDEDSCKLAMKKLTADEDRTGGS